MLLRELLVVFITSISAFVNAHETACITTHVRSGPEYRFENFQYYSANSIRYATSVPMPTAAHTSYAKPYSEISDLLPTRKTTTWESLLPGASSVTATDTDDQYGQAAWTSAWFEAKLINYTTTGMYNTTVSPTPIPTSELVMPPKDEFEPVSPLKFPAGFIFGVAGSASQLEGAVALEGRGPSIQEVIYTNYTAKDYVANEHYYMFKQDIERLAAIGTEWYSFTISWSRILPFGLPGTPVNQQAVDHYNDMIDTVLAVGMKPMVTILHFDPPYMFIQDSVTQTPEIGYHHGGFDNATFSDAYLSYGKLVMSLYGDRVPIWVTFNEPMLYAANAKGVENVVRSHAALYHWYKEHLNGTGKIGFKLNDNFGVPLDPLNATHVEAANFFNDLWLGPIAYPICLGKDYPDAFKMTIKNVTNLTTADLEYIGGTTDFFGIDPYTATIVSPAPEGLAVCASNPSNTLHPFCVEQSWVGQDGWEIGYGSQGTSAYIAPTYFREYFYYIWNTFKKPVFITEFGFPVFAEGTKTLSHQRMDLPRTLYYTSIMAEVLKSIWEDGVNIIGALAWTFIDDWEFKEYDIQYGLQTINRTTMERTYKKSFFNFIDFIQTRKTPETNTEPAC